MYLLATCCVLLLSGRAARCSVEQAEHRDFQYNSVVDPATGSYNFAYDTGNGDNEIAHAMHMQYRDPQGVVRGRYGYTDPRGKLRVVEYEAGPQGFVARGDVGPDQAPHDQTPLTVQQPQQSANFLEADLQMNPRPVQMAGWDPSQDPMGRPVVASGDVLMTGGSSSGVDGFSTTNATGEVEGYVPVLNPYDVRYPRLAVSTDGESSAGTELESQANTQTTPGEELESEEPYPVASPVNINNIDVNPDDIRVSASGQSPATITVGRSADGDSSARSSSSSSSSIPSTSSRSLPYSYRNYYGYYPSNHDHYGEISTPYRSVYVPSHGHYHYVKQPHDHEAERRWYYAGRPGYYNHDHDAERRYYVSRYTHDHDAEKRQTHDHDAEKKSTSNRQTHDHDAERRRYYNYYYTNRQTHDHEAEKDHRYYDTVYHQNNPNRRRIYYRDRHSMVPHEHYNDIYRNGNDRYHQHSDVHLYGSTTSSTASSSQNLEVPPTARPGQVKYVSSDKYHDKYYFWTD